MALTPVWTARLSMMGVNICVVAVLDATSVVMVTTKPINIPNTAVGTHSNRSFIFWPTQLDNSDDSIPIQREKHWKVKFSLRRPEIVHLDPERRQRWQILYRLIHTSCRIILSVYLLMPEVIYMKFIQSFALIFFLSKSYPFWSCGLSFTWI